MEEGREKEGGVALQGAAGAESCHCPCVTLQCTHTTTHNTHRHIQVKQSTKDKQYPELDSEYQILYLQPSLPGVYLLKIISTLLTTSI